MNTKQHEYTENRMNTQQYRKMKKKTRTERKPKHTPKHEQRKTAQTQSCSYSISINCTL